jgi:hypothetical protein
MSPSARVSLVVGILALALMCVFGSQELAHDAMWALIGLTALYFVSAVLDKNREELAKRIAEEIRNGGSHE